MPIYSYRCDTCNNEEEKLVAFDKRDQQTCSKCSEKTTKQDSYKFNATGLPNGFSATRSKSRR
jgi:putative FmdB family regulatory protein